MYCYRLDFLLKEFFNSLLLAQEFFLGDVESLLALWGDLQSLDDLVFATLANDRVREDEARLDAIASVRRNSHGGPFSLGSVNPVSNVVHSSVGSGGSAGELSGLDDGSSSLLNDRNEFLADPVLWNQIQSVLAYFHIIINL